MRDVLLNYYVTQKTSEPVSLQRSEYVNTTFPKTAQTFWLAKEEAPVVAFQLGKIDGHET
jgi:hypothetical protein